VLSLTRGYALDESFRVFGVDITPLMSDFELRYSIIAYIIALVLSVAGFMLGYAEELGVGLWYASVFSIVLHLVFIPVSALAVFGFVYLGFLWRKKFLVYCVLFIVFAGVFVSVFPLVSEITFVSTGERNIYFEALSFVASIASTGFSTILFGMALWVSSRDTLIRSAGVFEVFVGLVFLGSFLPLAGYLVFFIAYFLNLLTVCLEAFILYRENGRLGVKNHYSI
jgi:hypothetical protein